MNAPQPPAEVRAELRATLRSGLLHEPTDPRSTPRPNDTPAR